ncbi:MAG: helix-turn-helix transcriptional regulator [Gemmataceae bacterium]
MTVAGGGVELANKIARLVEERGWNQEDFARIANLNRHTVRQILNGGPKRRLRNATISQCAEALGLTVNELHTLSLERLLRRLRGRPAADSEALKALTESATLPDLKVWIERNKERASELRLDEVQEILQSQAPAGILEQYGVEHFIELVERRRKLQIQIRELANTEYLELIERFVTLAFEKVTGGEKNSARR